VNDPDTGDTLMDNVVVTPPGSGNCTEQSTDPKCRTRTSVAAYRVKKSVSSAKVKPGQVVKYTILVTNAGQVAFTTSHPAIFTDDLSAVLDDATYHGGAASQPAATITYSAPVLTWTGALPVGGTAVVTYQVTVTEPDNGDGKLHNVVTTPTDPGGVRTGNCPTGSSDPNCSTTSAVSSEAVLPPPRTAFTGNDSQQQLLLAGLLGGLGGLFLLLAGIRRRRPTDGDGDRVEQ
jgi:uncharacterized repeat protein (TIGR01451 family)